MQDLDPRKQMILQAVIIEYVSAAEPVGSELIVQKYGLGVKSATVRNEFAEMSELGFLEQPHTSAGRIPSDQGYRYYVDRLIVRKDPQPAAKQRVRDASMEGEALQRMLVDTSRVLSRLTHLLTVATTIRDANVTVRNAVVSALGPKQALLILVLSNGHVENRMIECPNGLTLQDIGAVNDQLCQNISGKTLRTVSRAKAPVVPSNGPTEKLATTLWASLRTIARDLTRGIMVREGEEFMLAQPEFNRDVVSITEMLDSLTESDAMYEALSGPAEGAQFVTIGKENRNHQMQRLSIVRHSFSVGESEAGVIAIIGPTRMDYANSIPLVSFTAKALSESLTRFFG